MRYVALLGDSIFDNAAYVQPHMDLASQLQAQLGTGWQVMLLAQDGCVLDDMPAQIARLAQLKHRPDQVLVSCGGNDVLRVLGLMHNHASTILGGLEVLSTTRAEFYLRYIAMLDALRAAGMPFTVCTIYDAMPGLSAGLRCALALFNDVILREASGGALPVLDLRLICTHHSDYARGFPIEPSEEGTLKIARTIAWRLGDGRNA